MTAGAPLDSRIGVETPEGVALYLEPAGVVPRGLAWLIDLAIRLSAYMVFAMVFAALGAAGIGLFLLALFALLWLYPVLFEVLWNGQTPGKRMMGLRVVAADGVPVGWVASAARNLLRTVDMLPLFYGAGVVTSLIDGRCRRLGDLAAGTLVVHVPPQRQRRLPAGIDPVAAPPGLLQADREALVDFAERAAELGPQRQAELAGTAGAVAGSADEAGARRLLGIAAGLTGRYGGGA
ncbi:MAG: RDD family protein [Lysobacteraceae bacterium]